MLCPAAALAQDLPCPTASPHVLGDWAGGAGVASGNHETRGNIAKFFLPPLSLWPAFPTPSHGANTEQGLDGETESGDLSQDLIPPQRSKLPELTCYPLESVPSSGSFPPRPPGKDHILLAQESRAGFRNSVFNE